jgi:hypothetical protein
LDVAGNKLDYRRYGEALLEILIAGGLLGNKISKTQILIIRISVVGPKLFATDPDPTF